MDFRFDSVEKVLATGALLVKLYRKSTIGLPFLSFQSSVFKPRVRVKGLLNLEQKIDLAISSTKSSESKK